MTELVRKENVYYLPAQPEEETPEAPRGWVTFRARLTRAWWRFRLTVIEIRAAIRHPGGRLLSDDGPIFLDRSAEVVERRRHPAGPARVIDFESARGRLRPVAQA